MRMNIRFSTLRPRRIARGLLLFVGLFAVVALALVGAVIALGVLAVGAVVHGVLTLLRGRAPVAATSTRDASGHRVIEGEFRVVSEGRPG
jgi:hypothetical protein